jgi:hypothetical protein
MTVHEVLAQMENEEENVYHIFIQPSEPNIDSDDDDDDGMIDNLSGRQLNGAAEVVFTNQK